MYLWLYAPIKKRPPQINDLGDTLKGGYNYIQTKIKWLKTADILSLWYGISP